MNTVQGLNRVVLTPAVNNWLVSKNKHLGTDEEVIVYAEFLNEALHWIEQFEQFPTGALQPSIVHTLVNTLIEHGKAQNPAAPLIKCGRGCSRCCYISVGCTENEAITLSRFVAEKDVEKLKVQAQADSIEKWSRLSDDEAACVFLNQRTGECQVYENRPSVCRLAHSLTPPSTCGRNPEGKGIAMIWWKAEAVLAGYLSISRFGPMPKLLLASL